LLDEIVIGIRATAGGVKEGVRTAQSEFKKLAKDKAELEKGIELKLKSSGIEKMQEQLAKLNEDKEKLQREIKLKIQSEAVDGLRKDLKNIDEQIRDLEESKKFNLNIDDVINAEMQLATLKLDKKELEEKIEIQIKADDKEAKVKLSDLNKEALKLERTIRLKLQEEGITNARDALHDLNNEMQEMQRQSRDAAVATGALAVAAFKAFSTVKKAVDSGVEAYKELEGAQSRLSHIMGNTMEATSAQVQEIITLTNEYEKIGVISAQAQQAGAQELATYLKRTESLKTLLPVLNNITAQQHGYNAAASQTVTVATMLGKVMEGQVGGLSRWGYYFDEAQKEVLEFGTEAEKVAMIMEFVGASVGGVNEALRQTDTGKLEAMATEAENLNAALGAAIVPMKAYMAEILIPVIRSTKEFVEANKGLVAGMSATGTAVLGVIAFYKAYQAAAAAKIAINTALAASNKAVAASLGPIGLALTAVAAVGVGVFTALVTQARESRRELEKFEDVANRLSALDMNMIDAEALDTLDEAAEELKKLQREMEAMEAKAEEMQDSYLTAADIIREAYLTTGISIDFFAEKVEELGVVYEKTGDDAIDHANRLEAVKAKIEELAGLSEQRRAEIEEEARALENAADGFEEYNKAIDESIKNLQQLETAYEKLSKGERISGQNLMELIRLYPQVAQYIKETGDLTLRNGEILKEVALEEERTARATIEANVRKTEEQIAKTELRIRAIHEEMEALYALRGALGEYDVAFEAQIGVFIGNISKAKAELADLRNQLAEGQASAAAFGSGGFGTGSSSRSKAADKAKDVAKELYEVDRQSYEDAVFFSEMSIREQIRNLEELREKHIEYADGVKKMDRELFSLRRELLRETHQEQLRYIEQISAREGDTFDFARKIELAQKYYGELMEVYAEYPETVKGLMNELDNYILRATAERTRKVAEMERAAVDEIRAAFEANLQAMKRMEELHAARSGLVVDGVEQTFGAQDRLKWAEETLREYDRQIAIIEAKGAEINEAERKWLEQLRKDRAAEYHRIQVITIEAEKEAQQQVTKIFENALRERERALKEHNKAVLAEIKERYAEEIRLAENAAAAEISIYEGRIKEIENLLKEMDRAGQDEDQEDRIKRLQAQLSYEVDDSNRYELEKQIKQEMADFEKRKRRESLDDERSALRDQIAATRSNLAEQKRLIQENRDAEIKMTEETLEAHLEKLEEQLKADMEHNVNVTKDFQQHLKVRGEDTKKFYRAEENKAKENQRVNFDTMSSGTTRIVQMLNDRVNEFAEAGRRAGDAWAREFLDIVFAAIAAAEARSRAEFRSVPASSPLGFSQPVEIHMHQTINAPVASPAQINRETEHMLNNVLRHR